MARNQARVFFPDGQVRVTAVEGEPQPGELLEASLPGQWVVATVEVNEASDQPGVKYEIEVDSAGGATA